MSIKMDHGPAQSHSQALSSGSPAESQLATQGMSCLKLPDFRTRMREGEFSHSPGMRDGDSPDQVLSPEESAALIKKMGNSLTPEMLGMTQEQFDEMSRKRRENPMPRVMTPEEEAQFRERLGRKPGERFVLDGSTVETDQPLIAKSGSEKQFDVEKLRKQGFKIEVNGDEIKIEGPMSASKGEGGFWAKEPSKSKNRRTIVTIKNPVTYDQNGPVASAPDASSGNSGGDLE